MRTYEINGVVQDGVACHEVILFDDGEFVSDTGTRPYYCFSDAREYGEQWTSTGEY